MDLESIKKTLREIEDRLKELETAKGVLRGLIAAEGLPSKRNRKLRTNTYRELMKKIMREDKACPTTTDLAKKLSKIKGKKVTVTGVRMALHRNTDVFRKVDYRHWELKKDAEKK